MRAIWLVLAFRAGVLLADPAVTRYARRVAHVARNRPVMYRITVDSGAVVLRDQSLVDECTFVRTTLKLPTAAPVSGVAARAKGAGDE